MQQTQRNWTLKSTHVVKNEKVAAPRVIIPTSGSVRAYFKGLFSDTWYTGLGRLSALKPNESSEEFLEQAEDTQCNLSMCTCNGVWRTKKVLRSS